MGGGPGIEYNPVLIKCLLVHAALLHILYTQPLGFLVYFVYTHGEAGVV